VAFADTPDGGWDPAWGPFCDARPDRLFCSGDGCDITGCAPGDPATKFTTQAADPANFGRFEFIRLVLGELGLTTDDWAAQFPGTAYLPTEGFAEARAHIEADTGQQVAGLVAQNLDHDYRLGPREVARLAALGIDAPALLAKMNARRYARDPVAADYMKAYFEPTGRITGPVVLMKDVGDWIVPPNHDYYYREAVERAGRGNRLLELFRPDVNHCGFTLPQLTATLAALREWIATGQRPARDWSRLGFVQFEPRPFPYLARGERDGPGGGTGR
jgi:hypothetical protein